MLIVAVNILSGYECCFKEKHEKTWPKLLFCVHVNFVNLSDHVNFMACLLYVPSGNIVVPFSLCE